MLKFNIKYDSKQLLRSRWIQLLGALLILIFGFAAFNGKQAVEKRKQVIREARQESEATDQALLHLLDSVSRGLEVSVPSWTIPSSPMALGNYYPRLAAMDPQPLAFLAVGQADLYTHLVKPTVTGDDSALNFTEMTSPVQLLFGSFDPAFVMVYLLPLLIIAFSYNILSEERESGTLRLLAAQPIRLQIWLLQRLGIRFLWLSLLVTAALAITFLVAGSGSSGTGFPTLLALVLTYMLFWFGLAFLVNILGRSSSRNAVSLISLWVILVLLVPSVLNQMSDTLYPMPSRTLMINELRKMKTEVSSRQDEILDNFLRDHPEYALNDTAQSRGYYHRYMASQELVRKQLEPIVSAFETQLRNRQDWLGTLRWLSPAIALQEALFKMAGTSSHDYEQFRRQVVGFSGVWRAHLMPYLYDNRPFTREDYADLPQFAYSPEPYRAAPVLLGLLLIAAVLFALGFTLHGNSHRSLVLEQN